MVDCEKCGEPTRVIYPYVRRRLSAPAMFDNGRVLPRSAIAALNPAAEAAIPWGEHPEDNSFGKMCERCAIGEAVA